MKKLMATVVLLLLAPTWVSAREDTKDADHPSRGQGYVFIGPLVSNTRYVFNPKYYGVFFPPGQPPPPDLNLTEVGGVNAGFGGDVLVYKGLGVGAEAAFAGPDWDFSTGSAVGVASFDPSYHFFIKSHPRIEPFATGGYSFYFGDRTDFQSGFNLGCGLNFWVAKHVALRSEVRYQDGIHYFHSQLTRFVAFRFGVTFR